MPVNEANSSKLTRLLILLQKHSWLRLHQSMLS